ncbi:O-acetyl-ADP-ribose deacetylase [Methylacidiphilum caldifontis]|uniref:RNase III inhibitor n=1 Tax=Methylacidiphilum caldifontis TaxID=2795386 RepID=A0A4Y8PBZ1_9BACT|nr:O-acetyl-ADP-ribose deacetylase [Methylacidiphilum caldifontis]QSR88141.1 O-acetyl-ADP-ribose deacetylase [Methylacidiphilum caldifontis]TFE68179.1 RNase III inhibitor [Methylacidiphilum caldifontis]
MGIEDVISRIELVQGDITQLKVDAVVNAANSRLIKGGGVDGAIHRAAGPRLAEACAKLNGCPTGQAKVTPGFDMQAKWIIHAVGPVWKGGQAKEKELLASCYNQALLRAIEVDAHSVAFPAISTGVYGFPPEKAAKIAWKVVCEFLESHLRPEKVIFCLFDQHTFDLYAFIQKQLALGNKAILNEH